MYIKKVEITNIRSIRHFKMAFAEPAGWHVLIGDNGSGKSSILKAISLAIIGINDISTLRLNLSNFVNNNSNNALSILELSHTFSLAIELKTVETSTKGSVGRGRDLFPFETNKGKGFDRDTNWFTASYGPFRRFTGGSKEWEQIYQSNPRVASHISIFGEDVALTESLEWLVNLNYKKLEGDKTSEKTLNSLIKFINQGELLPHNTKLEKVSSAGVTLKDGYGNEVNITEMSDGFRSVLSMTFDILRQMVYMFDADTVFKNIENGNFYIDVPGVILIDEVDAHLHPTWQTNIGKWFTKYFPKIQFIVSTHNPLVCRASENGSIWRLAAPDSNEPSGEVTGIDKERLVNGNILDAYGTELFGEEPVRSDQHDELKEELGRLNMLYALGKINPQDDKKRLELQQTLSTDDPTGF